jgi:DnaJ domain
VATHYEVLGVARDASPAAVRRAYLDKARALHPDRHAGRSGAELDRAQRAMQDVNAAWAVLADPRKREAYDLSMREPPRSAPNPMSRPSRPVVVLDDDDYDDYHPDDGPVSPLVHLVRIGPVVLLLGVLAAIFVISAFAAGGRSVDLPSNSTVVEGLPEIGSCIDTRALGIVPVACDAPAALRVERVIEPGEACADGAVPMWWEEDVMLCVRPPS